MHVSHTLSGRRRQERGDKRERTILFSCSCAKKKTYKRLLVEWEGRREAIRFFSLLLPANKIDRIQNVATKNPFSGKEKKKKKKKKPERTRTHTFTNTHIDILNQSKYLEFVSININMSVPTTTSKFSMTC